MNPATGDSLLRRTRRRQVSTPLKSRHPRCLQGLQFPGGRSASDTRWNTTTTGSFSNSSARSSGPGGII